MKARGRIRVVLLVFVGVSLAWLGAKEVARSRAVKALRAQPAPAAQAFPAEGAQPSVEAPAGQAPKPTAGIAEKAPVPTTANAPMLGAKDPASAASRRSGPGRIAREASSSKVVVYYLHTTARCPSCLKIEAYTAAEVTGPLSGPLSDGRLEWKVLNVDEPENAHFVDDYQLYTKSVVVSEVKDGKEIRWKRLDKVWDLLGDQQAFMKYVDDEVRAYLKDLS